MFEHLIFEIGYLILFRARSSSGRPARQCLCLRAYGSTVERSIRIAEIRVRFSVGPQTQAFAGGGAAFALRRSAVRFRSGPPDSGGARIILNKQITKFQIDAKCYNYWVI